MRDPEEELGALEASGLRRRLRRLDSPQGRMVKLAEEFPHEGLASCQSMTGGTPVPRETSRSCLNFSSNDYLGLTNHPKVIEAAHKALDQFACGMSSSRVQATTTAHVELEALAQQRAYRLLVVYDQNCGSGRWRGHVVLSHSALRGLLHILTN